MMIQSATKPVCFVEFFGFVGIFHEGKRAIMWNEVIFRGCEDKERVNSERKRRDISKSSQLPDNTRNLSSVCNWLRYSVAAIKVSNRDEISTEKKVMWHVVVLVTNKIRGKKQKIFHAVMTEITSYRGHFCLAVSPRAPKWASGAPILAEFWTERGVLVAYVCAVHPFVAAPKLRVCHYRHLVQSYFFPGRK